jgi:alanyl-tRNA synthetase
LERASGGRLRSSVVTSDEIRERYLAFFEEHGHLRIPSASLVPSAHDPSALLTLAGMHPLKPYFLGLAVPPAPRLTDCQKCFRTVDIDRVGHTSRHLTFFEMLGNFSIGDYFKTEAIEMAWELSRQVLGFPAEDIWVTVFEGDDELGLGPDDEAIEQWLAVGVPRERIVLCPRSENFWQAGPTGPCGPCSELYLDRGLHHGTPDDLPGEENERFLEYWNLVFMQYELTPPNQLTPLPARNIDTGLGLNRLAAILQDKPSVFETDQFWPLIELGQELSGARYGEDAAADRALRILADHCRAMTFLVADGVVPSNEDRGYVLRRVMRRAIHQGRVLEMEPGMLVRYSARVRELMGAAYPELESQHEAIDMWLSAEEDNFSRTLAQGLQTLRFYIDQARGGGVASISAEDAFRLHDTWGFPFDLTRELLAEEQMTVDDEGFERLMDQQRTRARTAAAHAGAPAGSTAAATTDAPARSARAQALKLAADAPSPTRFTGYETEQQATTVEAVAAIASNGDATRFLVKLADSPFYAVGGGQVADSGVLECEHGDCAAKVTNVLRLEDDQALEVVLASGVLEPRQRVLARVDHATRHATECNHTATHLLHAALRSRLGTHVRQAGSYVGPDKLRFDFTHTHGLSESERADVEDQVNAWIAANDPVRALTTTRTEAERLGAMALFGEKYGDVVRMVEVGSGEYSRELCGGTHVHSTGEIGVLHILSEGSSAANVRRIEAVTGPAAVALLRARSGALEQVAAELRVPPEAVVEAVRKAEGQRRSLQRAARAGGGSLGGEVDIAALAAAASELQGAGGAQLLVSAVAVADAKLLLDVVDSLKRVLKQAVIVLGASVEGRVHLVASVAPELVARGIKAGAVVQAAAAVVGGGGGGRDTLAQAGGRDPERLQEALQTARAAIERALSD